MEKNRENPFWQFLLLVRRAQPGYRETGGIFGALYIS